MKIIGSSIKLASSIDDNEVVSGRGAIDWSDASRKLIKSKSQIKNEHLGNSNNLKEPKFLTFKAKEAFNHLKQAFTEAPIFQHFDL